MGAAAIREFVQNSWTVDQCQTSIIQEAVMKQELIAELFQRFEEACYLYNETECWSARDLQANNGSLE